MTIPYSILRIAAVAIAVIGIAATAVPAQAAPALGGSLELDFGVAPPAGDDQVQFKKFGGDDDDDDWCYDLTNKQIRKGLRNAGFEDIDFIKDLSNNRVRVEALYEDDGWVYSMRIDRCDGDVDKIKALYEADDFDIDFDP
jgi:hypothetical protein